MALQRVETDGIKDSAITAAKIADGTVVAAEIAADAIDGTKIADDAINSEHYTDGSIDLAHLSADCVDGTKIADDAINSEHYTDGSIDTEHFSSGARNTISLDGSPDTNNTANGPQTNTFASGYQASITDLVVLGNASKWVEADADATATSIGLLGIALESKNDTQLMNVALSGSFVRGDGWNWTPGAPLYIGNTLGAMVEAKPTGTGDIVRTVGYAVTPTVIFFSPSSDYVTLA